MWGRKTSWKPSVRRIDGGSGPRRGNMRPGRRHGSRLTSRKANKLGFLARTPGLKFRKGGPAAGAVCVRLPAKPMKSVTVRKPPGLKIRKGGPGAGTVCVRLPAKPINSVFVRKPPGLKFRKGGPGAGTVCVRLPAKPMKSVTVRKPPGLKIRKGGQKMEKPCIVSNCLTIQGFLITYCSPCELSSV